MAENRAYTGIRPQSASRMLFDAGAAVININEEALETSGLEAALSEEWTYSPMGSYGASYILKSQPFGATRGGATFDPGKEERQIEVNGTRADLVGFSRTDRVRPMLTLNLLELADINVIKYPLGQIDVETTASGYHKITPRLDVEVTDYIGNIALLIPTSEDGQDKPAVFVVRNVKVVDSVPFQFDDPGEASTEVSFIGHNTYDTAYDVPYRIYLPVNEDGLGSGS